MPDKYQEEIEEILSKVGDLPSGGDHGDRERNAREVSRVLPSEEIPNRDHAPASRPTRRLPSISSGKIMLLGLILLVIGLFGITPLVWIGLGTLGVAYLLFFIKPRSLSSYDKYWRGRSMDEAHPSPLVRFFRWLKN